MENMDKIQVEVAYSGSNKQAILTLLVTSNLTVNDVIQQSGILQQFPEIDLSQNKVGIFSKLCDLSTHIKAHDRIEIYRPLIQDPKTARKTRVESKKFKKGRRVRYSQR